GEGEGGAGAGAGGEAAEAGAGAAGAEASPAEAVPSAEAAPRGAGEDMRHFLSKLDSDRIVAAIAEAEKRSSGEIRVHVTRHKPPNVEEGARRRFERLGLPDAALRDRGLLHIDADDHRFQI